jgi:hypothetical protein
MRSQIQEGGLDVEDDAEGAMEIDAMGGRKNPRFRFPFILYARTRRVAAERKGRTAVAG